MLRFIVYAFSPHFPHNVLLNIFHQEEQTLILRLKDVFKKDLGLDYTDDEMNEILDCFYRNKPKFI